MDETDETKQRELWDYAVWLYGRPGVREACLDLQDRCGLDVNLLLFAVWSAAAGPGQLDVTAFKACDAMTAPWRDGVLIPLRAVRRAAGGVIAGVPDSEREAVVAQLLATELQAERVELDLLARWAREDGPARAASEPQAAAASNLVACLAAAGVAPGAAAAQMRTLLAAAFSTPPQA